MFIIFTGMKDEKIQIGHGSGGKQTSELIKKFFVKYFDNQILNQLTDSAILDIENTVLAYTTDSYVVDPVFFPGGDIGKLAICGTVNDLSVSGAIPVYISAAFIIEEGFDFNDLRKISESMAAEAGKAGVKIVTGDTKVVSKGQCDKIFITTTGIGILNNKHRHISTGSHIKPGDAIIVNGYIGDHGIAVLGARENIQFEEELISDCASLNHLIQKIIQSGIKIRFMRDLTRGGLATVLSELTDNKPYGIIINEHDIPVREVVKGTCEIFGFDPLYLANEGKVLMVVDSKDARKTIEEMMKNADGVKPAIIGKVTTDHPGKSVLNSIVGGKRIIDRLAGEMLPRIC
ncbi:MAG TPA: hydrogenase expression/formation protein HypE [Bacteroidales bacterium]|nr:hydrogenase expression/formation protein HypE [Bacteroidales bacterium]